MAKSKARSRPKAKAKPATKKAAPKKKPAYRLKPSAKTKPKKGIPPGFTTLTAHIVVEGAADAMDFYKRAFGAEELGRAPMPDGQRLMHGLMRLGDSMLMLVDAFPEFGARGPKAIGGSPVTLHVYVEDADEAFQRALDAGCTVAMPLADMFWGDRYGKVRDPFGHEWSIATKIKDMTPEEMEAAQKAAFAQGKPGS
jgi:uncharacterized glyoxalase superfamily protein PhnB